MSRWVAPPEAGISSAHPSTARRSVDSASCAAESKVFPLVFPLGPMQQSCPSCYIATIVGPSGHADEGWEAILPTRPIKRSRAGCSGCVELARCSGLQPFPSCDASHRPSTLSAPLHDGSSAFAKLWATRSRRQKKPASDGPPLQDTDTTRKMNLRAAPLRHTGTAVSPVQ